MIGPAGTRVQSHGVRGSILRCDPGLDAGLVGKLGGAEWDGLRGSPTVFSSSTAEGTASALTGENTVYTSTTARRAERDGQGVGKTL